MTQTFEIIFLLYFRGVYYVVSLQSPGTHRARTNQAEIAKAERISCSFFFFPFSFFLFFFFVARVFLRAPVFLLHAEALRLFTLQLCLQIKSEKRKA